MARPLSFKPGIPLAPSPEVVVVPGGDVETIPCWDATSNVAPMGVDYLHPSWQIPRSHAKDSLNLWLDRGKLRSRYGTSDVGAGVANLVAAINFITASGIGYLLRFTTTLAQLWDGVTWTTKYSSFTGSASDKFVFTGFGNKLVFSNGVDGMFEFDPDLGTIEVIAGAPACRHITTFGGRVLASNIPVPTDLPSRIKWCVKFNHKDWTGIGSGYEDMTSTPGGQIDQQRGVFPITDDIGLVVRSGSIWQMTVTGSVDAPFRFGRLFESIGSNYPYSLVNVPGGVCGLFNDGFHVISNTEIRQIGELVNDTVLTQTTVPGDACAMYDPVTRNYWFSNQTKVYRFSFRDQGWTPHSYPFSVVWMTSTKSSAAGLSIDSLDAYAATIDGLDAVFGTIDSMVGGYTVLGNYFASGGGGTRYIIREDSSVVLDSDGAGGTVDSPIEIISPAIGFTPKQLTRLLRIEGVYEDTVVRLVTVSYSLDNGATYSTYSTGMNTAVTTGAAAIVWRKTISAKQILIKIRAESLGRTSLQAIAFHVQRGAMVNL